MEIKEVTEGLKTLLEGTNSTLSEGSYAEYSLPNGDRDDEVEETKVYRYGKNAKGKRWVETIVDEKTVNILGKDITYMKIFHQTENADPDDSFERDRYTWQVKNEDELRELDGVLKGLVKSQLGVDDSKIVGGSTMIGAPQSIEG